MKHIIIKTILLKGIIKPIMNSISSAVNTRLSPRGLIIVKINFVLLIFSTVSALAIRGGTPYIGYTGMCGIYRQARKYGGGVQGVQIPALLVKIFHINADCPSFQENVPFYSVFCLWTPALKKLYLRACTFFFL